MCRICGRVFRCVLDSMPSRTLTIPRNRRSVSLRASHVCQINSPLRSLLSIPRHHTQSSTFSTLSSSLSRLSLGPSICPKIPTPTPTPTPAMRLPISQSHQPRTFSTSAALGAKRNTYNPSRRVQKRRSGFLARVKSRTGRLLLARRRLKGRKNLSY